MLKNARTLAMGGCLAALGTLSIVSVALGQEVEPPHNCKCGPVTLCSGVPVTAYTTCDYTQETCYCPVVYSEFGNCIESIGALCIEIVIP